MNIDMIKKQIISKRGKKVKIIYNGLRSKYYEYEGEINEVYNYVFTVKLKNNLLKCFSYSDVITNQVKLYFT